MSEPMPSRSPFSKPKAAPMGVNHRAELNLGGRKPRRRQATVNSKNAPKIRTNTPGGVMTKRVAPISAKGMEPRENHPTTGAEISFRLNQARPKLEERLAMVRIGMASRTPK